MWTILPLSDSTVTLEHKVSLETSEAGPSQFHLLVPQGRRTSHDPESPLKKPECLPGSKGKLRDTYTQLVTDPDPPQDG